jgi:DNA-binding PadR family transcriptional regulator
MAKVDVPKLEPLTPPVFHILLALAGGEMHGYAIMQDVEEQTAGALQMGPGTLYGCIKRMLAAGLIEESGERLESEAGSKNEERRRYYRITKAGSRAVRAEAQRLHTALSAAKARRVFAEGKA